MKQQDYEIVARAIRKAHKQARDRLPEDNAGMRHTAIACVVDQLVKEFTKDNPNFKPIKFRSATVGEE